MRVLYTGPTGLDACQCTVHEFLHFNRPGECDMTRFTLVEASEKERAAPRAGVCARMRPCQGGGMKKNVDTGTVWAIPDRLAALNSTPSGSVKTTASAALRGTKSTEDTLTYPNPPLTFTWCIPGRGKRDFDGSDDASPEAAQARRVERAVERFTRRAKNSYPFLHRRKRAKSPKRRYSGDVGDYGREKI